MLRFYFWVLEGPQLHKKFRAPRTSHFGDMRVKVSTFPPLPPKLDGQIPSIFCIGYTRDNLQKLWKFCESLTNSFQDIQLFTVRAYRRDTIVSSTLKAESLYSDEYSFTTTSSELCRHQLTKRKISNENRFLVIVLQQITAVCYIHKLC